MNDKAQTDAIRAANDAFRQTFQGGAVVITAGIIALGAEMQERIFAAVSTFDEFCDDNDPWHEHDFGSLEIDGEQIFFKIDYYDLARAMHSDDPANPSITERVMTIALTNEW